MSKTFIKQKKLSKMSSLPNYTYHVTPEKMAEETRKATAEGMRQIAEAMAVRHIRNPETDDISEEEEDSSDESYSDSDEDRGRKRYRYGSHVPKVINMNNGNTERLESRIRFLQLDLSNAYVEIEDEKAKVNILMDSMSPYKRVNDELSFLKGSITRALQNTRNMTKLQLDLKYKLFHEEANEHAMLCNAAITKITFDEVKSSLLRVLTVERKRIIQVEKSFKLVIFKTNAKEIIVNITTTISAIVVILAVVVGIVGITNASVPSLGVLAAKTVGKV